MGARRVGAPVPDLVEDLALFDLMHPCSRIRLTGRIDNQVVKAQVMPGAASGSNLKGWVRLIMFPESSRIMASMP